MATPFPAYLYQGANAPAMGAQAAVAGTPFNYAARSLYVGVGGDVAVLMADGSSVVFAGVPSGAILPVRCSQVVASGTTASSILALF